MKSSRRTFLITSLGAASALALSSRQALADAPKVPESDPTAQALGYKEDATKVDKAKYAKYAAGQTCANCQFYQGKATDAYAPCPMFGGKQVKGSGWCSAYSKRAA
jgi:High potential iron-sulfur protein